MSERIDWPAGITLEGRFAKTEFGLWTGLVALTVADVATTVVALSLGLPELNPLVATLVHHVGPIAIVIAKMAYLGAGFTVWRAVDGKGRLYVLAAATCLSALVVANNLAWLIALGGGVDV